MTSDLQRLCDKMGVTIDCKYGAPDNPTFKNSDPWTCTLHYQGRRLTVPFYMGYGHGKEPTSADVLSALVSDASGYDNASGFEDWASEYGFDVDSRQAEEIWRKVKKSAPKVHRLLGDDFDKFARASH